MSTIRPDLFTPPHKGNSQRAAQGLGSFYMSAEGLNQGELPDDGKITIQGSGFGSRFSLFDYYDNYNEYADGTTATEIGYSGNGGQIAIVSDESHEGSGKALERLYAQGGNYFPRTYLEVTPSDEIYLAFWAKWNRPVNTAPVGVFKLPRGGSLPNYTGVPRFYETVRGNSDGVLTIRDGGFYASSYVVDNNGPLPFTMGQWHFCEYYFRLSTPGVSDGEYLSWVDGQKTIDLTEVMTRESDQTDKKIEYFINFFDGLDDTGDDTYLWQSEEYAASTRARVVVTDNPIYASSTNFQIQSIDSWSDTEIVLNKNVGGFESGVPAYAHVFNDSGQLVNSTEIEF